MALGELLRQALEQIVAQPLLFIGQGGEMPLVAETVVERDEGRLAAHGQAHIRLVEHRVDLVAQRVDRRPFAVGIGLGDAARFVDAFQRHLVAEGHIGAFVGPGDRGCTGRIGRTAQRDMALTGEHAGRRIEADPASPGQIDLVPGVQIGNVPGDAGRPVQRFDVGLELDRVAGDEARRQALVPQDLTGQPRHVAARALQAVERLGRGLYPGLHAQGVAEIAVEFLVEGDQEIDRAPGPAVRRHIGHRLHVIEKDLVAFLDFKIGRKLVGQAGIIGERVAPSRILEEKVERIEDLDLKHEVDLDAEIIRLFRKNNPRQIVAERVLLPVDEVPGRLDLERIGLDMGLGVRCRTKADDLGAQIDRAVVTIIADVVLGDENAHAGLSRILLCSWRQTLAAARHLRNRKKSVMVRFIGTRQPLIEKV